MNTEVENPSTPSTPSGPVDGIDKTPAMLLIERAYEEQDIRAIILDEIRAHDRDADAIGTMAKRAGIELDPSLLNRWIHKLQIHEDAKLARSLRRVA